MKLGFCSTLFFACLFSVFGPEKAHAKIDQDTLLIDGSFQKKHFKDFASFYVSNEESFTVADAYKKSVPLKTMESGLVSSFNTHVFADVTLKNIDSHEKQVWIEIPNILLQKILFYEKTENGFQLLNTTGSDFPATSRMQKNRTFLFPLVLGPKEVKTIAFTFEKKSISYILPIVLWAEDDFKKQNQTQFILIGLYIGLSFISIFITLFIYFFLRNTLYLVYALYVLTLGIYLLIYLGIFSQFFLPETSPFNNNIYIFFMVVSVSLFVVFSQMLLNAKKHKPKLKRLVDMLLIALIVARFSEFFVPKDVFAPWKSYVVLFWYFSIFFMKIVLIIELVAALKKEKNTSLLYAIAFFFMGSGTVLTIVHHNWGVVNSYVYGLPIILYTSALEILFLTFSIVYMVKGIYDERNVLSKELAYQQQRFLTAFITGQEKERERIGAELHDNIGSKLSELKRFFVKTRNVDALEQQIDGICEDVRSLSHKITPSEIKLVGLTGTVSELTSQYAQNHEISIDFNCYQFPKSLDENIATNLYRIIQEALNNIGKHANASKVDVQLIGHEDAITLAIEDNGKGFNAAKRKSGIGLQSIQSRVAQIKGKFLLDTSEGKGTSILISIPTKNT